MIRFIAATILLSAVPFLGAAEVKFELDPVDTEEMNYGPQLVEAFGKLLEADSALRDQFHPFSSEARERSGGKYMGPRAISFTPHRGESVEFAEKGGTREYWQTVVIYFSFEEGFRKGMEGVTGVFAVFELKGNVEHGPFENGDHAVLRHTVEARFEGFRDSLSANRES